MGAVDSILSYLESNCPFFIHSFCVSVYYIFQHDFTQPLVYLELLALACFFAPTYTVLATECVEVIAFLQVRIHEDVTVALRHPDKPALDFQCVIQIRRYV
jgi:hypothetical protein